MASRALTAQESEIVRQLHEQGRLPTPDDLVAQHVAPEEREFADTATAHALGADYRLVDLSLAGVAGNFSSLYLVDSPFVSGDTARQQAVNLVDVAVAIYVLAEGRAAVAPIMAMQDKLAACKAAERMAEKSPQHLAVYMDRFEAAHALKQQFQDNALAFYNEHVSPESGLQEVTDFLVGIMNDAFEAASLLSGKGDGEKKTAEPASLT